MPNTRTTYEERKSSRGVRTQNVIPTSHLLHHDVPVLLQHTRYHVLRTNEVRYAFTNPLPGTVLPYLVGTGYGMLYPGTVLPVVLRTTYQVPGTLLTHTHTRYGTLYSLETLDET